MILILTSGEYSSYRIYGVIETSLSKEEWNKKVKGFKETNPPPNPWSEEEAYKNWLNLLEKHLGVKRQPYKEWHMKYQGFVGSFGLNELDYEHIEE